MLGWAVRKDLLIFTIVFYKDIYRGSFADTNWKPVLNIQFPAGRPQIWTKA